MTQLVTKTKLHLGCGHIIKEGWINRNIVQLSVSDGCRSRRY